MRQMQSLLWALVLLLNLLTLVVFGVDKLLSRRPRARRVPERTLLWSMFFGGFPGAWVGMGMFRHKTVKQPFRFWAVIASLLSPLWLLVWWTWRGG